MTMSKSEQAEFDRVTAELEAAKAALADRDATIATQAATISTLAGAGAQASALTEQLAAAKAAIRGKDEEIAAYLEDLADLRAQLAAAKAAPPAPPTSPAPARPAMTKRPIGRIQGEHGFLAIGDTHAFDTLYRAGDVMSSYAIDFYGPEAEAEYLARRTGLSYTKLVDGTPRVTVPSQPQAIAVADDARKLVAQDAKTTKVRVQALGATGLQVQDAARGVGAGLTGPFAAIAAPRGANVSAVVIDGVKGYLIEP